MMLFINLTDQIGLLDFPQSYPLKKKYCLKYLKQKSFLNFKYLSARPSKFLNFFFINIECIEDYNIENNKQYHYLKLYNKVLSLSGIENKNLNHYPPKINFNFNKKLIYLIITLIFI